ncbi:MAG: HAD-IA family hydrolase [Pseudohongiella sp.]|nr:HAD-IA family hydrolase [Pseudohongiella sp.]MDO9519577.1 HAD-IA family hydrolase [Pseudohongiella sp.]MDP2127415.1 HAD-IA family hydrolase [Pseudohongiella sp.]
MSNVRSGNRQLLCPGLTVLFDLDGTLVDTAPDFQAVLNHLCAIHNVVPPSAQAIHSTVSSGARALITLSFNMGPENSRFPGLLQELLDSYERQIDNTMAKLYPDMDRLLQLLEQQSIPWGVVTNKPERFSKPLMAKLGLMSRCAVLICPDHVRYTKPHPEPLLLACTLTGGTAGQSIYVGDHPRDIEAGKAAGMKTIAAAYGYMPESPPVESWEADLVVGSAKEIIDYFWPGRPPGLND